VSLLPIELTRSIAIDTKPELSTLLPTAFEKLPQLQIWLPTGVIEVAMTCEGEFTILTSF
jgi:hypothetical protein